MFRKPYVEAKQSTTTPSFSRLTSWKSLFLEKKVRRERSIFFYQFVAFEAVLTDSPKGLVGELLHVFSKQLLGSIGEHMMEVAP